MASDHKLKLHWVEDTPSHKEGAELGQISILRLPGAIISTYDEMSWQAIIWSIFDNKLASVEKVGQASCNHVAVFLGVRTKNIINLA